MGPEFIAVPGLLIVGRIDADFGLGEPAMQMEIEPSIGVIARLSETRRSQADTTSGIRLDLASSSVRNENKNGREYLLGMTSSAAAGTPATAFSTALYYVTRKMGGAGTHAGS